MSDQVIRVEGLSKSFRLGHKLQSHRFTEFIENVITNVASLPKRLLRQPQTVSSKLTSHSSELFWALKDVSFEVNRGEVIGFIGHNGAGKSTLLKILSRIMHPTAGRFEIKGRVRSLLEVGTGFHQDLTGRENIFLNGAILGMSRHEIRRKFDDIVAFSEVQKFLDTPVKYYSSGMYVRLAFAVAAHLDPEIMIIDEVLAVGDAAFQKKCIGKMGDDSRQGKTILIVTHNLSVVTSLCKRAILLESGKVTAVGDSIDVARQYMETIRTATGEMSWNDPATAPGNEMVQLAAIRIVQDDLEGPATDVDISKEISIQVEYRNKISQQKLFTSICLRDGNGTMVLKSSNADGVSATVDPWSSEPQPEGLFQSTCTIPANFLNQGRYTVSMIIGLHPGRIIANYDNAVAFDVHHMDVTNDEYFGHWTGSVVRPRLPWNTIKL